MDKEKRTYTIDLHIFIILHPPSFILDPRPPPLAPQRAIRVHFGPGLQPTSR
jgi:hypothetical protein